MIKNSFTLVIGILITVIGFNNSIQAQNSNSAGTTKKANIASASSSGDTIFANNGTDTVIISSGPVALLCANCGVTDETFAFDGNVNTASSLNMPSGAAGSIVRQTLIFPTAGNPGDEITIYIQKTTSTSPVTVTVATFSGTVANNDTRIVNFPTTAKNVIKFKPVSIFDRVQINLNAGPGPGLSGPDTVKVYEAQFEQLGVPVDFTCEDPANSYIATKTVDCIACDTLNPSNAIDGDDNTFATLRTAINTPPLGEIVSPSGSVSLRLNFPLQGLGGDSIVLILEDTINNFSIAGQLDSIYTRTYNGLTNNNDLIPFDVRTLTLIGNNKYAYVIYPPLDYTTVELILKAGSNVLHHLRVYSACHTTPDPLFELCSSAESQANGTMGACVGCNVQYPNNAIDNNQNNHSNLSIPFTTFDGQVYQDLFFVGDACASDTIRMIIEAPGGQANAQIAASIQLETLLDNVLTGDILNVLEGITAVEVVPGSNLRLVTFPTSEAYDGVRLRMTAMGAGLTVILYNYGACNEGSVTPPEIDGGLDQNLCTGESGTLRVTNAAPAGYETQWFDAEIGGNLLTTGSTLAIGPFASPTVKFYWVQFVNTIPGACTNPSRVPVKVTVSNVPAPVATMSAICYTEGQNVTINPTQTIPDGAKYKLYDVETGGTAIDGGTNGKATLTVRPFQTTTYWVAPINGCESTNRTPVVAAQKLDAPTVNCALVGSLNQITFTWTPVENAVAYKIFIDTINNVKKVDTAIISGDTLFYTNGGRQPGDSISIRVMGIDAYGCDNFKSISKECKAEMTERIIFFPNTFTPNEDGRNDVFEVFGQNIIGIRLRVFNQLGQQVYSASDVPTKVSWDGKYNNEEQPNGVYAYTASVTYFDGVKVDYKGTITLVR